MDTNMNVVNLDHIVILAKLAKHQNFLKLYHGKQLVELDFNSQDLIFKILLFLMYHEMKLILLELGFPRQDVGIY